MKGCQAFSQIKHSALDNKSRQSMIPFPQSSKKPETPFTKTKKTEQIFQSLEIKTFKVLFKSMRKKLNQKIRLTFLKLKIHKIRKDRQQSISINPYMMLSITLRHLFGSKLKESFNSLKFKKSESSKRFSTTLRFNNESSIMPGLPPLSENNEKISDISIPSVINAISLAQQQRSVGKSRHILGDNVNEIEIREMKNGEYSEYSSLSLNLIYKSKRSKKNLLSPQEKTDRVNEGLMFLRNCFKKKKLRSFMYNFVILCFFRFLKVRDDRAIFLDYAANSFQKVFLSLSRQKKKEAFKSLKNHLSFQNFERSSKKIFFKIGLATLLLTMKKSVFRGAKWSLRVLKKNHQDSLKEENRMSALRKRYHNS